MSTLRIAVVGVGALGQHHASKLSAFEDVELIGVVDAREEQGRSVAQRCGTEWFPSVSSLPDTPDAVVVAVPTAAHCTVASEFLKKGVPVLVEKPLAANLQEAETLRQLADEHQCILQVGHIERFNPAYAEARKHVTRPLFIRCQRVSPYAFRSMDIGVVHDLMIHDIDLVLDLVREPVETVEAFGAVTIGPHEDFAVGRLRFQSGCIADLTVGRMCPEAERSMQIWDPAGVVSVDLHARTVNLRNPEGPFRADPSEVHRRIASAENPMSLKSEVFESWMGQTSVQAGSADALESELREFVDCVKNQSTPRVGGAEAVAAMEIAERVLAEISLYSYQKSASGGSGRRAA